MNHKFLDYYNQELTFMKESAREFAEKHRKIAGRLGMRGIETADPYVERLIEAFCFLSARTHLKSKMSSQSLRSGFWTSSTLIIIRPRPPSAWFNLRLT